MININLIYLIIIMYGNIYFILLGLLILGFASANFFPIVIRVALNNTKDNLNTAAANLSTIGFLGFLVGPAIVGYTSEIYSISANTKIISFIWVFLFIFFFLDFLTLFFLNELTFSIISPKSFSFTCLKTICKLYLRSVLDFLPLIIFFSKVAKCSDAPASSINESLSLKKVLLLLFLILD